MDIWVAFTFGLLWIMLLCYELSCATFYMDICLHFFFLSFVFIGPNLRHMEVPRHGLNQSCSRWPTPQPQQHRIWAASATYTTAHSNARSLTHWARPRIEPLTSWLLVEFVNHWATMGAPNLHILKLCVSFSYYVSSLLYFIARFLPELSRFSDFTDQSILLNVRISLHY